VVEHLTCILIDSLLGSHGGRDFSGCDLARADENKSDSTEPESGVKAYRLVLVCLRARVLVGKAGACSRLLAARLTWQAQRTYPVTYLVDPTVCLGLGIDQLVV